MASPASSWRAHPFQVGLEYEARVAFHDHAGGEFIAGKRYALNRVSYSHYDCATVFRFQSPGDEPVDWWWRDDDPETLCVERFRLATIADSKLWRVFIVGEGFRFAEMTRDFELTGLVRAANPNEAFRKACELALKAHPELAQATGPFPRPVINADEIQEVSRREGVGIDTVDLEWR